MMSFRIGFLAGPSRLVFPGHWGSPIVVRPKGPHENNCPVLDADASRLARRLGAFLLIGPCLACGPRDHGIADLPPPNVVLLVVDTLRADHIHGYGYTRETTPNLDAFIAGGARFDNAIAPGSWSPPSQITIITGVNPYRHKVLDFGHRIEEGIDPLAVILEQKGYATGLFSSHLALHNGVQRSTEGVDFKLVELNKDAKMVAAAHEWARSSRQPYFLYLCLTSPHATYDSHPPSYEKLFTDMPPDGERTFPFTEATWVGIGGIPGSVRLLDRQDLGFYINRYDREIRHVDDLIGEFWSAMEQDGLTDNTLLVVTSDHGEGLGDHNAFAHEFFLYDFLVRVPLIVHHPERVPAGQNRSEQVILADIAPTILGFVGVDPPPYMEGMDLSGFLVRNVGPEPSRLATGSYRARGFERYMVRSERHKLIHDASAAGREEFYDLTSDPGEYRNLIASRSGQWDESEYQRLRARLNRLRELHQAIPAGQFSAPLSPEVLESLRALGYLD